MDLMLHDIVLHLIAFSDNFRAIGPIFFMFSRTYFCMDFGEQVADSSELCSPCSVPLITKRIINGVGRIDDPLV